MNNTVLKCDLCGGDIKVMQNGQGKCIYCGTETIVKVLNPELQDLLSSASYERMLCEFDRAKKLYEEILEKNETCVEALWGALLCEYGIEYVKDNGYIPTCHRTRTKSFTEDSKYLKILSLTQGIEKATYEQKANEIEKIRHKIIELAKTKKSYDIFICYKEKTADAGGKLVQTSDSVWARDIYYDLEKRGFKVFFAGVTLDSLAGEEYEPNIYAALNSSKVMLVIASHVDYLNSAWVKNEWGRFAENINGTDKKLIVCYKNIDPYDFPTELKPYQALQGGGFHFKDNLFGAIYKCVGASAKFKELPRNEVKEKNFKKSEKIERIEITKKYITESEMPKDFGVPMNESLHLKRAEEFMRLGDFSNAKMTYERILATNPYQHEAYWGAIMASVGVCDCSKLILKKNLTFKQDYFEKAVQFAPKDIAKQYVDEFCNIACKNLSIEAFNACLPWVNQTQSATLANIFYAESLNRLNPVYFDLSCLALDEKEVDKYIERNLTFSNVLRKNEMFSLAEKYYLKVLKADESCQQAIFGLWLCSNKIASTSGEEFNKNVLNASNFKALNKIYEYGFDENTFDMLTKVAFDGIKSKNELTIKKSIEIFDEFVSHIPKTPDGDEYYKDRIGEFGYALIYASRFNDAAKYFDQLLSMDNRNYRAYFGKLLIETKCKNKFELAFLKKPLFEYQNFENTCNCSLESQVRCMELYKLQGDLLKDAEALDAVRFLINSNVSIKGIAMSDIIKEAKRYKQKNLKKYDESKQNFNPKVVSIVMVVVAALLCIIIAATYSLAATAIVTVVYVFIIAVTFAISFLNYPNKMKSKSAITNICVGAGIGLFLIIICSVIFG